MRRILKRPAPPGLKSGGKVKYFVVDTHALIWFLTADERLGKKAREILLSADGVKVTLLISIIVLFEILDLIEKRRVVGISLKDLSSILLTQPYFEVRSVDLKLWQTAQTFGKGVELHDRMIAALAKQEGATVITKDKEIKRLKKIETVW